MTVCIFKWAILYILDSVLLSHFCEYKKMSWWSLSLFTNVHNFFFTYSLTFLGLKLMHLALNWKYAFYEIYIMKYTLINSLI